MRIAVYYSLNGDNTKTAEMAVFLFLRVSSIVEKVRMK